MSLPKLFSLPTTAKAIAGAVLALLLLCLILQVSSCLRAPQEAAQAKVEHAQGGAFGNSAADAVDTVGTVAANQSAGDDLTRSNEKEIRNAQGSDARVDPAADRAGRNSLCRRAAYSHRPECAVRVAPPG